MLVLARLESVYNTRASQLSLHESVYNTRASQLSLHDPESHRCTNIIESSLASL
jgi:hypothetical protein